MTVYDDGRIVITLEGATLRITAGGRPLSVSPSLRTIRTAAPTSRTLDGLRAQGLDPATRQAWDCGLPNGLQLALPVDCTAPILAAQRDYQAELDAEANDPARIERARINRMYARADRLARSPSDDNVAGPARLRAQASAALAAWRQQYPAAAAAERADHLLAQAANEDRLAVGALTYDADGSIGPVEQERRAAEHRANAARLRAEAASL